MAEKKGNPNWKKGVSGNPNGRPRRGNTLTDILKEHLEIKDVEIEDENGKIKKITRKNALAEKLIIVALGGDVSAIKYIFDRIDGPIERGVAEDLEYVISSLRRVESELLGA